MPHCRESFAFSTWPSKSKILPGETHLPPPPSETHLPPFETHLRIYLLLSPKPICGSVSSSLRNPSADLPPPPSETHLRIYLLLPSKPIYGSASSSLRNPSADLPPPPSETHLLPSEFPPEFVPLSTDGAGSYSQSITCLTSFGSWHNDQLILAPRGPVPDISTIIKPSETHLRICLLLPPKTHPLPSEFPLEFVPLSTNGAGSYSQSLTCLKTFGTTISSFLLQEDLFRTSAPS